MNPEPTPSLGRQLDPLSLADFEHLALRAARAGGRVLQSAFRQTRAWVQTKSSSTDMVSDADARAQATIVTWLRRARPDDGLLAEESSEEIGASGLRWVVDPLDGTTNFLYGLGAWGVSVAVEDVGARAVLAGAVVDPVGHEAFSAHLGGGARRWTRDGRREHLYLGPESPTMAEALVATGFSYDAERRRAQGASVAALLPGVRDVRRVGAASLDLCWTAAGHFDAYYEEGLKPWDFAAGRLIAEEAGCLVVALPASGATPRSTLIAGRPPLAKALADWLSGSSAQA